MTRIQDRIYKMKRDEEHQMGESRLARICWNEEASCKGAIWAFPDQKFHFIPDKGQTLDGCPLSGAILEVSSFFGSV